MSSDQKLPNPNPNQDVEVSPLGSAFDPRPESPPPSPPEHQVVQEIRMHQGPLPSPETLAEYDKVIQGGAERLFCMAEKQQKFRHDVIRDRTKSTIKSEARGQRYGLMVCLSAIGAGTYLTAIGMSAVGVATILGGLGPVLIALAYGIASGHQPESLKPVRTGVDTPPVPQGDPGRVDDPATPPMSHL